MILTQSVHTSSLEIRKFYEGSSPSVRGWVGSRDQPWVSSSIDVHVIFGYRVFSMNLGLIVSSGPVGQ